MISLLGCAGVPGAESLEVRMEPRIVQGGEAQVYVRIRGAGTVRYRAELVNALTGQVRPVGSGSVTLQGEQTVLHAVPARDRGLFTVRVDADGLTREAPLRVASRQLRVLYVEHPPRYEHRFLKNALIRDPEVLAHVFLTSADEGFPQEHTPSDDPLFRQPLEGFPRDLRALCEFDVIIVGDVDPARLGPEAAKNLEAFVRDFGGGIVFISGMMNNPRSFFGTRLEGLLPVVPADQKEAAPNEKIFADPFAYRLTRHGFESPIIQFKELRGDREKNLEHWEGRDGLTGIRWFIPVRGLKPDAKALVEVTGHGVARAPLFVTMEAGHGRVFWSATDETWLWRYLVGDYPWFYPFWRAALDWAAGAH